MDTRELRSRFARTGERQGWWHSTNPVVLAVSGGSDSIALLWLFYSLWNGRIVVAHLEHGIRGESSKDDARYVAKLSADLNVPCEVKHLSVPDLKNKGESTEEAARRLRYAFLNEVCSKYSAKWIALGHTADDVAETVLMNLSRGTGPYGLVGIPEKRDAIVRPLIGFRRNELRAILREKGILWREDSTNESMAYLRNRIRHELLPMMENRVNTGVREHLIGLSRDMYNIRNSEETQAHKIFSWLRRDLPFSMLSFDLNLLKHFPITSQAWLLREAGKKLRLRTLSRRKMENLLGLIANSGRWRFQWQEEIEVCCGSGIMAWVIRSVINSPEDVSSVSFCDGCDVCWNSWTIRCERSSLDRSGAGSLQIVLCSCPKDTFFVNSLYNSCSEAFDDSSSKKRFMKSIPWWLVERWPVLLKGHLPLWSPLLGFFGKDLTFEDKENSGPKTRFVFVPHLL